MNSFSGSSSSLASSRRSPLATAAMETPVSTATNRLQTWGGHPVRCRITLQGNRYGGSLPCHLNHGKVGPPPYTPNSYISGGRTSAGSAYQGHPGHQGHRYWDEPPPRRISSFHASPGYYSSIHQPLPLASYHSSLQNLPHPHHHRQPLQHHQPLPQRPAQHEQWREQHNCLKQHQESNIPSHRAAPSFVTSTLANKENEIQEALMWPGPRTVVVQRTENGFGFTLRHFIVYPPESAVQGQNEGDEELEGPDQDAGHKRKRTKLSALEPMDTIFVKNVKDGGPAQQSGLHTGDRIVSVNGESVTGKTYSQVIALIQSCDSNLKLLVVPRDEDILQMAYQNSAYNQGQEPYRGSADEIPEPPPLSSSRGSAPPSGRNKPPVPPRYKSELKVVPEDEGMVRRTSTEEQPRWLGIRTSSSSLASTSSGGTSSSFSHDVHDGHDSREQVGRYGTRVENTGPSVDHDMNGVNPTAPVRSSSKNVVLAHLQIRDANRSGSLDSISRSSDSSLSRRSQDGDSMVGRSIEPIVTATHVPRVQEGVRRSNENIGLGYVHDDTVHGSSDSLTGRPHSRERVRRSSEGLLVQGLPQHGPVTASRLPVTTSGTSYRPMTTYGRSHTTSSLLTSAPPSRTVTSTDSSHLVSGHKASHGDSWGPTSFLSSTYIKPYKPPVSNERTSFYGDMRHGAIHGSGPIPGQDIETERPRDKWSSSYESGIQYSWPDVRHHGQTPERKSSGPSMTVCIHDSSGSSTRVEVPRQRSGSQGAPITITTGRSHGSDRQLNMVAERRKWFQSLEQPDGDQVGNNQAFSTDLGRGGGTNLRIEMSRSAPRAGHDIARRVAVFEGSPSDDNPSDEEPRRRRRTSSEERHRRGSNEERHRRLSREEQRKDREYARRSAEAQEGSGEWDTQRSNWLSGYSEARPPPELQKVPSTPPATISIYFRPELAAQQTAILQPSPERTLSPLHVRHYSDSSDSQSSGSRVPSLNDDRDRDRSPIALRDDNTSTSPLSRRSHKAAVRQPSYLSAIHSPKGQIMPASEAEPRMTDGDLQPPIVMRQQSNPEDREAKLKRRTSYLMATGRDRPQMHPAQSEMSKSDSQLQPSLMSSQIECKLEEKTDKESPQSEGEKGSSASKSEPEKGAEKSEKALLKKPEGLTVDVPRDPSGVLPEPLTTPTKTSNIRKLKAFFGEKTPRIVEATSDRQRVFDMPVSSEIAKEGMLFCKMAISDGKRASDRSWKPMWTVLRGHALYLYKDKASANSSSVYEEQPISVKASITNIAHDYTKKKNVFRLTTYNGSEYLFQADDQEMMMDWIHVIQANNNPDNDEKNVASSELIMRKTYEQTTKTSPQVNTKSLKKSTKSLRAKSPASHSPSVKQQGVDSPKVKDQKEKEGKGTWKGKVAKKFRRYGSSSSAPVDLTGTFNVPIELCPTSSFSEHIPLVVELCTNVVEARGLENQGIYRVPGNTGAVNQLQDELNKDAENIELESDKWLDVNVVSSLLKSFFRKLPEPLITDDLYDCVINANRLENPEKRMLRIKKLLHELPDHNFETFRYLAEHLDKVACMGHMNKMDARNLAIVFGPTLVRTTDESMVTMVKDMSDQCRIVESIIMHYNWFFGSWDMDMYVPLDEVPANAVPLSGMNQELLSKAEYLELGERGRDISAKDIVSSIIGAANRKIKKKDKGKGIGIEGEGISEPAYNERNIDREIELRRVKEYPSQSTLTTTTTTTTSSASLKDVTTTTQVTMDTPVSSASQSEMPSERDGSGYSGKVPYIRKDSETSATTSSTASEESWSSKPQFNRYPAYPPPDLGLSFSTENSKPAVTRRFSEDILSRSERRGDDEIDHRPLGSGGLTYAAQQHLRRIVMETQALRQKEEERRIEQERRALDRQRIEHELAKTKYEMEREESIEDLLAKPTVEITGRTADSSSKFSDYSSRADSTSIASDYSTTSSTTLGDTKPHSLHTRPGNLSDYSSSASPTSIHGEVTQAPGTYRSGSYGVSRGIGRSDLGEVPGSVGSIANGGKYFTGSSSSGAADKHSKHSTRDDIELYRQNAGRPVFDTSKIACRGTLTRKRSTSPTRKPSRQSDFPEEDECHHMHGLSTLQRKGSLDSLRDFYDKGDQVNPYLASDSDNGEDLLESISTSLNEKYKGFLHPQLTSDPPTSKRTPPVGSESTQSVSNPRPLQSLSSSVDSDLSVFERTFQNPSLHRVREVGIASRFERKDRTADIDNRSPPLQKSFSESWPDRHNSSTGIGLHRDLSDPGSSPKRDTRPGSGGMRFHEVGERETSFDEPDSNLLCYAEALRKSSEKLYGSRERLLDIAPTPSTWGCSSPGVKDPRIEGFRSSTKEKAHSASPPLRRKDPMVGRKVRRRHTVGGSSDYDHLAALEAMNGEHENRRSAWERLQPLVRDRTAETKTVKDWCERERLRIVGSSPAILGLTLHAVPDQLHYTKEPLEQADIPLARHYDDRRASMPDSRQLDFSQKTSYTGSVTSPTTPTYISSSGSHQSTFTFESSI